jgi:DNA polymerase-3 subunit delta'
MSFSAIANQEYAKAQLIADLTAQHFPSYLFVGPKGVGKRTTALVLAKALCCENKLLDSCDNCYRCKAIENLTYPEVKIIFPVPPNTEEKDIFELQKEYAYNKMRPESPSNGTISIDRIRELKYEMGFPPIAGRRRVVIILDADKMTPEAANSFLKTLEEPQAQTSFILTTERSSAILATIRSRCQMIRFFGIKASVVATYLEQKTGVGKEKAVIAGEVCEGSMRRALEYIKAPEQFLAQEVKEWFENKESIKSNLSTVSLKLKDAPIGPLINSLLFIYRQAILAKLGIRSYYSAVCQNLIDPENKISLDTLLAKLEYLLKTIGDAELYLNKRLFIHSILVHLLA